jgi:hypothetical protein
MRHTHFIAASLIAFASACTASACTVERGESNIPDQELLDAGTADTRPAAEVGLGRGPGAGTMSGTWLLYHERSTCVTRQEQLTHATYLVDIDQQGATVSESRRLCDTQLSPLFGMRVSIPQVVLENIVFADLDKGVVSTLREGGTYVSSTEVALWGVDLDQPDIDPIPTDPDDPQVRDSDGDGHPGVTLQVGAGCMRYQGQRQVIKYRGSFTAPNQIDGESTGVTDIAVYGGSDDLCTIAPAVTSNDAFSRFRMVRVDGRGGSFDADADADGEVSCDEAMQITGQVLDERAPDHANCAGS